MNNSRLRTSLKPSHNSDSWQLPTNGYFKINFDGVANRNTGPAGFGGSIKNSKGIVLSIFLGSIKTSTNSFAELEGFINGLTCAL